MKYSVLFEDSDEHSDMRAKHMSEHLDFLSRNLDRIDAAGPLTNADNGSPGGGLWIVEAESVDEVRKLTEEDPFWPTGLRKSISILKWKQVFANGQKMI